MWGVMKLPRPPGALLPDPFQSWQWHILVRYSANGKLRTSWLRDWKHHLLFSRSSAKFIWSVRVIYTFGLIGWLQNLFGITDDFCRYLYMLHGRFSSIPWTYPWCSWLSRRNIFSTFPHQWYCLPLLWSQRLFPWRWSPALFIAGAHYIIIDYFAIFIIAPDENKTNFVKEIMCIRFGTHHP